MKAIEKNISQHKNGTYYLRVKRQGKTVTKSLQTKNLREARNKIEALGLNSFFVSTDLPAREPAIPEQEVVAIETKVLKIVTLKEALAEHEADLIHNSKGRKEMAERCARRVIDYAADWEHFAPLKIWKAYRASGLKTRGKELGSACNHMRWFLGSFVNWAVEKNYLPMTAQAEVAKIPKIKVNPRRIRVPSVETVRDFLAMVETEDPKGAEFLRFLGACGLRLTGARSLSWSDIDFNLGTMLVKQKGKTETVIPMTPEAQEILLARRHELKPWDFSDREIKSLRARARRFSEGFDIDLTTFHSFRHYFASRCLLAGLTVQEVADLLGHADDGQLVLRTYGHLCREHLRSAVAKLKLIS